MNGRLKRRVRRLEKLYRVMDGVVEGLERDIEELSSSVSCICELDCEKSPKAKVGEGEEGLTGSDEVKASGWEDASRHVIPDGPPANSSIPMAEWHHKGSVLPVETAWGFSWVDEHGVPHTSSGRTVSAAKVGSSTVTAKEAENV